MASTHTTQSKIAENHTQTPVLRVTRYDVVTSSMFSIIFALFGGLLLLGTFWYINRLPETESIVPMELLELPGGIDDGSIEETLRVDSPEDVTQDPTLADTPSEEAEVEEMLENVLELSDQAALLTQQQFVTDVENSGKSGSATGTGRRALGVGPGDSGLPREQRWFVRFGNRASLDTYAKQLDAFGIELGALVPGGSIVFLSQMSTKTPKKRTVNTGKGEKRLYMNWQSGSRREADIQLFRRAGINAVGATIFHFYPKKTEQKLARLEFDHAQRPADQIRRTYFVVRRKGSGYVFVVTRQSYFN